MNRSRTVDAIELATRKVRQMRIDFERYFNGALEVPPEDLVTAIRSDLKRIRNAGRIGTVERFKLSNLESQFNSYTEMFQRRVRHREISGSRPVISQASVLDPQAGVIVDANLEERAVAAIYQALSRQEKGPNFDLNSFRNYLGRQLDLITTKTGARSATIRVADENGKLKLKVKPILQSDKSDKPNPPDRSNGSKSDDSDRAPH